MVVYRFSQFYVLLLCYYTAYYSHCNKISTCRMPARLEYVVVALSNDDVEEEIMSMSPEQLRLWHESDTQQPDTGDPHLDFESDDQQAGPSNRYPILDGHITISAEFDQYVRRFNTTGRAYTNSCWSCSDTCSPN